MVRFHAGDLSRPSGPASLVPMPDSNKSIERGEKRGLADTETAKKASADDDEED